LYLSQEVARRLASNDGGLNTENLNKVLYSPVLNMEKVKFLVKKSFDDEIGILNIKALEDAEAKELVDYVTEKV